jgi:hypothetical protein
MRQPSPRLYPELTIADIEARTNAILQAAADGDAKHLQLLVMLGVNPNSTDSMGRTPLHVAAIHDHAAVIWVLVRECGANPASLNRDGKTARDLAPAGSSAYKALEWLEELPDPKYAEANAKKRVDGFECPVCLEDTKGEAIAFAPCGHRVCPGCWAKMREHHTDTCPACRAPIAHGEPQDSWPDRHPLYSRFRVEVGGPQESLPGQQMLLSRRFRQPTRLFR